MKNGRLYTASPYAQGPVGIYDIQNVGDLNAPVPLISSFEVPGGATHSAYPTEDGRFVVVTREWLSYDPEIWDISDLAAPKRASRISVPRDQAMTAHQPAVVGNLVYFAWFEAGIRVYNIADPYNPVLVGDFDTYTGPYNEPGECAGRAGNGHGPVSDFDPYPVACGAWGIYPFLGNDRILVSDFDGGLIIVSLDNPLGDNSLTAASTAATAIDEVLRIDQVPPLLSEAVAQWQRAGFDVTSVSNIEVAIADLPHNELANWEDGVITFDVNAAGVGWFVDATPFDNSEFDEAARMFGTAGLLNAANGYDLLTAAAHEVGHALGFVHSHDGVMAKTLAVGERYLPGEEHDHGDETLVTPMFDSNNQDDPTSDDSLGSGIFASPQPLADKSNYALENKFGMLLIDDEDSSGEPVPYLPEEDLDSDSFFSEFEESLLDDLLTI